jgi:hypothetical protein
MPIIKMKDASEVPEGKKISGRTYLVTKQEADRFCPIKADLISEEPEPEKIPEVTGGIVEDQGPALINEQQPEAPEELTPTEDPEPAPPKPEKPKTTAPKPGNGAKKK